MKKMIMHMVDVKANKIARAMGIEGIGSDGWKTFGCFMGYVVVMWGLMWIFG